MRIFTGAALATGVGDAPQLLLCILGSVFDVTKGRKYYGNGGGYSFFAGRDATRAYVTGDFTEKGLVDDVRDLSRAQWKELCKWRRFFNETYVLAGVLGGGPFYDVDGVKSSLLLEVEATEAEKISTKPTDAAVDAAVDAPANQVSYETETDTETVAAAPDHPRCNKRWTSGAGGQVWCDNGYPRAVLMSDIGQAKHFTCQCVPDSNVLDDEHHLYQGCAQYDKTCSL